MNRASSHVRTAAVKTVPASNVSPPLALICLVAILGPSLAALPGDSTWSPIFTAMLAAAGAWQCFALRKIASAYRLSVPGLLSLSVVALALLSLGVQWLFVSHGQPHYMDAMLKSLSVWVALWSLLATASAQAKNRVGLYAFALCLIVGATLAASQGLSDYLRHVRAGELTAREFGTSTPDFFAGFLVISIPLTLALFLGAPSGNGRVLWLLYGIAFLVQAAVLPTTGSRFGLISFALSLVVLTVGLLVARKHGLAFGPATRARIIALTILVVVFAGLAARPILNRLQSAQLKDQTHSADFRVWTWKGAAKYAVANPILGTGPGTFVYVYPKYAYVGFTRHAHNAYLQVADELGIPATLVLLALFGTTLIAGSRRLSIPANPETEQSRTPETDRSVEFLQQAAPSDDRFLLCGLLAGAVAGLVQNLVDADFYVFFNGAMLWGMLGLILALSRRQETKIALPSVLFLIGAAACLAIAVLGVFDGLAGFDTQAGDYVAAASLNPLDPQNQRMLGVKVYPMQGDAAAAERALHASENLAPDSTSYTRIGNFEASQGRAADAITAYQTGLRYEPQSLTLLLALADLQAKLGHSQEALAAYRTMAAQESVPYGQVRAIPEVSEVRYAFADESLGDDARARGDLAEATAHYLHAKHVVEDYLVVGGASYPMRLVMTGGQPDTELDARLRDVYVQATNALEEIDVQSGKSQDAAAIKRDVANHLSLFSGTVSPANR